jgi:myo-inositol-1(or 4)-monophosphatase
MNPQDAELLQATLRAMQESTAGFEGAGRVFRRADPVTSVDIAIDERLRQSLPQILDVPVVSEESERDIGNVDSPLAWVIDPIDGTHNLVAGLPDYGVSVALVDTETLSANMGACWLPARHLLFSAREGAGAYLNGQRLPTIDPMVDRRLVAYGMPAEAYRDTATASQIVQRLMENGLVLRQTGSAVSDICQVASGAYLGFVEEGLMLWDFVAADVVAREVGAASWRVPGRQPYAAVGSFDYAVSGHPDRLSILLKSMGQTSD